MDPAAVVALTMTAQLRGIGKLTLPPPHESDRGQLVFAPIFGGVAWVLHYGPAWSALTREGARTGLWVTDTHGANSHALGSVETTPDLNGETGPTAVKWSPDGDRLSFIYRNALWTVPTE